MLPSLPSLDQPDALRASHGFSEAANWLVPGHVLLGANPSKGRGGCLNRVVSYSEAGCSTWVSLQAELPPMDSDQPFPFGLENYAVEARAVAPTTQAGSARFVRFPIEDLRPAESVEWLSGVVDELAARVLQGEVLYLHCFAGRGRTGLVAACLLGKLYPGIGAEEALQRVGAYYRLRASYGVSASRAQDGMSPETEPQRQQVRDFYAQHASGPAVGEL